ncbi:helix-turn-helix domain-containing protein [Collinsella tanakaei]|uniref:helix-turn-helix domain-containing protein n=1 Tax=Collinsella tanakaei TaxID=626935 RepID=UPI0025A43D41|nr:helix-turn-helix transcriptional regulator [Collinsella tanakaei]
MQQARKRLGYNKVDFSLMAHISRPTLDAIEAGRTNIKLNTLNRLANALDMEAWELLT